MFVGISVSILQYAFPIRFRIASQKMTNLENDLMFVHHKVVHKVCIHQCWTSIYNGVKEPTCEYQSFISNQMLILGGYVWVWQSLYVRLIIWVNTKLNRIDTRVILPRYESSSWYIEQNDMENKNTHQIHVPYWYQKTRNPHYRYLNGVNNGWYQANTGMHRQWLYSIILDIKNR